MAIQINKNQPIVFNLPTDDCIEVSDYIQIVDQSDTIQFQSEISPCLGALQLCTDSSFDDYPTTYWYGDAFTQNKRGEFCHVAGSWAELAQDGVFEAGNIYQVTINVLSIYGTIIVRNGWSDIGTITQTGANVFTFIATNPNIKIRIEDAVSSVCISSITAYEINKALLVAMVNNTTDEIDDSFTYESNPERFVFAKNTVTVSIPLEDLPLTDGCYRIGFDDACNNTCGQLGLFNGSLEQSVENDGTLTDSGWVLESGTIVPIITSGVMTVTGANSSDGVIENQITDYCAGIEYRVQFSINSIANCEVQVQVGDAIGSVQDTTGNNKLDVLTPTIGGKFKINITGTGAGAVEVTFGEFIITLLNTSDYSFTYESEVLKLGTFDCSVLFNISNDNDAFGFVFVNSGFAPRIRLDGTIRNSTYKSERKLNENSLGVKQIYYGRQRKSKELAIDGVPEYVHDFISLGLLADHLFIDGVEYSSEDDDLNITYPNGVQDWGSVIMLLTEKEQKRENRNVGNPSNPISATEEFIVDPIFRNTILTEPSTNDTVEAL